MKFDLSNLTNSTDITNYPLFIFVLALLMPIFPIVGIFIFIYGTRGQA